MMGRVCKHCCYERKPTDGPPKWVCPQCEYAYVQSELEEKMSQELTPEKENARKVAEVRKSILARQEEGLNRTHSSNDQDMKDNDMTVVYKMKGVGDLLEVYEEKLTITPKGVLGFMAKGMQGTKTIPYSSITAIQLKEAGTVFSGYIQFSFPGGNESKGGLFAAATDENTFMFADENNNDLAIRIVEYIESSLRNLHAAEKATSSTKLSDELLKIAKLKEQGILSDEEFLLAKKKLIE